MAKEWWKDLARTGGVPKLQKSEAERLVDLIPKPGEALGHRLPYRPVVGDEWREIERIAEQGGGPQVVVEMGCTACGVRQKFIAYRALLDQYIKWLCDDCLDAGFDWSSQIPMWEFKGYQIVRPFKDDTLIRKLSKAPNFKEGEHRPIEEVERTKGLERRGQGPKIVGDK